MTVQCTLTPPSSVQGGTWDVLSGTGRFEGLRGGGSMVAIFGTAIFGTDTSDTGRDLRRQADQVAKSRVDVAPDISTDSACAAPVSTWL